MKGFECQGDWILEFLGSLGFLQFYVVESLRLCDGECFYKSFTEKMKNWARLWRADWHGERLERTIRRFVKRFEVRGNEDLETDGGGGNAGER